MEENEKNTAWTSDFVSRDFSSGRRNRALLPAERRRAPGPAASRRSGNGAAYLLIRLGVCAVCFCGILGLKLKGDDRTIAVIGEIAENGAAGSAADQLGRLKFVELPSIIDVFAPSDSAVLPVDALRFELGDENELLMLTAASGAEIVSPSDGTVRAIGEDEDLGRYIRIAAEGDVEYTVYGLGELRVENGQPVKQRQTLGTSAGSSIAIRASKSGRPIDLAGLFDVGKADEGA